jgi:hypothetical protein
MELTAIAAIDIRKNCDGVLDVAVFRAEHDHVFRGDAGQKVNALIGAFQFGQVFAGVEIVQLALQQELAVGGDVSDVRTHGHFVNAGQRRIADIRGGYAVEFFRELIFAQGRVVLRCGGR